MSELRQLNRELLSSDFVFTKSLTVGCKEKLPVKVMQFGEGNFLRAFVDWMIDEMNSKGVFSGAVSMVQPIDRGLAEKVNEQDGLYTLLARGIQNGKVTEDRRLITSVVNCLNPYSEWNQVIETIKLPELRLIVSNTTEAGIAYSKEKYYAGKVQNTFPAKLTSLLYERFTYSNGDVDKGLIILPCELIEKNGTTLKNYVLKYAADWKLGSAFEEWIGNANYFLSTLVDRIVPGYPRAEADKIQSELGYNDNLIDTGEIFHLFVIEGPQELSKELPFSEAGLNVVWTDDMAPYRTQKVRFLNGAHTSNVLAAYLGGVNTVGEMMEHNVFGKVVEHIVFQEIMESLDMDKETMFSYAGSVLERFKNPFIRHELISISLNSVSKWKVRVMPSLIDYCNKKKELPKGISFSLAALIAFYKGTMQNGEYLGHREENDYKINDSADVTDYFNQLWNSKGNNYSDVSKEVLGNINFWEQDLTLISGLQDYVSSALKAIIENGAVAAAEKYVLS